MAKRLLVSQNSTSLAGLPLILLTGISLFLYSVNALDRYPSRDISEEMRVSVPRFVQILVAAGDRYLAANMGAIRSQVSENLKMDQDQLAILARVQSDVAWLNPAHEDNYYTAAAVLPWSGHLPEAEFILHQAALARPHDPWPAFHYGFLQFYFRKNPVLGADWLRFAATQTEDETERLQLEDMAARWYSRGPSTENAIGILEAMAKNSRHSGFRAYLDRRVKRLRNLQMLQRAVEKYIGMIGHPPHQLVELLTSGVIQSIPDDPFGVTYGLDAEGNPMILTPQRKTK